MFFWRKWTSQSVWNIVEVMRRDFNKPHMTQVHITVNQLGKIQPMEKVSEHVGMKYLDTTDSSILANSVNDFLFTLEDIGLVENAIALG